MQCPYCKKYDSLQKHFTVVDSRPLGNMTKRKRRCYYCHRLFVTYEEVYKERNDDVQCKL
jgi:transcriptional regulator NrdR family protein